MTLQKFKFSELLRIVRDDFVSTPTARDMAMREIFRRKKLFRETIEHLLKHKVSQITFSGHRVNDRYTMNKRKAIVVAVLSVFDEAAEQCVDVDEEEEFVNPYLLSGEELDRAVAFRGSQ